MKKAVILLVSTSIAALPGCSTSTDQRSSAAQIQTVDVAKPTGTSTGPKGQSAAVVVPESILTQVGTVKIRSAADMVAARITSPFSIGAETTDRNFSTYDNWKAYLGPLGIASARVQTGWADVEPTAGARNYDKLKAIVTGMKGQSVQPWMDLVYGNPLFYYEDGEFAGLGSPLPTSVNARAAWIKFVKDTVGTFNTPALKVNEWQLWNEPDGQSANTAAIYAQFAVETAKAIKQVQPDAKILLGAFTGYTKTAYIQEVLDYFDANKGPTIADSDVQVVYHAYQTNPDSPYTQAEFTNFKAAVAAKGFTIRQGESGAPSQRQSQFALADIDWTEDAQAKYDLRRLLNDFRYGIPSNLFTLTELHYANAKNYKGLLQTGAGSASPPTYGDQTVQRPKVGYRAIQAMTAIFDNRLTLLANQGCTVPTGYTLHAYTRLDPGNIRRNMLVVWRNTDRPGLSEATASINITCTVFNFPRFASNATLRPRYTDLLTGKVYALDLASTVTQSGTAGVTITALPVYDSPVVLSDQGIVPL